MALTVGQKILYGILGVYLIYAVGAVGLTGILFSAAIGLILNGVGYNIEICVAGIVLSGLLYKFWIDRRREGFEGAPTGAGESGEAIVKRIKEITNQKAFEPTGVLSSNATEGFEDVTPSAPTPGTPPEKKEAPQQTAPSTSSPAPTNAPTASVELAKQLPTTNAAAQTVATATQPPPQTGTVTPFADQNQQGMFQLGAIPPDVIGGAHVDVGTTLMNALNSLKPDQMKQMTEDTRKLLETQKSLMGMLTNLKPMLNDGKDLMQTFSGMFGK